MREAFAALWSTIIMILEGITAFASAFKAIGQVAEANAAGLRDEELASAQARLKQFQARLEQPDI